MHHGRGLTVVVHHPENQTLYNPEINSMNFPTAKKIVVKVDKSFELTGDDGQSLGIFQKLTNAEAKGKPSAVRALLGKTLTWFDQVARPDGDLFVSVKGV